MADLGTNTENDRQAMNALKTALDAVDAQAASYHAVFVADGANEAASITADIQAGIASFAAARARLAEACAILNDAHNQA